MNLAQHVDTLNLLGDESRIRLCALLRQRELCVTDLVRVTGISQSRVSTHLGRLREAGFVRDRRQGAQSFYALATDNLPSPARLILEEAASSDDPTLEGDRQRLVELDAERRGGLPDSAVDEIERDYSPGRTWQSLAVGVAALLQARRRARRRLGRRRGGELARALLPLAHLHRHERAHDRGGARAARPATRTSAAQVADVHELPFAAASFDAVLAVPHAHLRRASGAGAGGVRARAAARRAARAALPRQAPAAGGDRAATASATPASRRAPCAGCSSRAGLDGRRRRGRLPRGQEAPPAGGAGDRRQARALHRRKPKLIVPCRPIRSRSCSQNRIAIIDGAMGTTIRTYGMKEADIRGERFKDSKKDLLNNGDLFSLTQPEMICDIHRRFLEAGADIIETNTFGATSITQSEFFVDDPREHGGRKDPAFYQKIIEDPFLDELAWEINEQSARQCREWADRVANADGRQRFVAGAIGPLTVSLSNSPDADDAGFRVVTFDQVKAAYVQQVRALIAGGVDMLLVETIFDSLNAKAALVAIQEVFDAGRRELPVMISAAVGRGGETMISAQTVEAFWNAVEHVKPLSVGLNCSLGPDLMYPFLAELAEKSDRRRLLLPERRPAEPALADRLRSRAGRHGPLPRRVRARRPAQHRRRLLRQHARAHRRHREGARRQAAARRRRVAGAAPRSASPSPRPVRPSRRRRGRCACRARSRSRSSRAST